MGVTNCVAAFQRAMPDFISDNGLDTTYAYLDDLIICGRTQEEHDKNLQRFLDAAEKYHLQLNEKNISSILRA